MSPAPRLRLAARERQPAAYRAMLPSMRAWLVEIARARGKVTYKEFMNAFGIGSFILKHAMDILGHASKDAGEPIITAVIVSSKTGRCSEGLEIEFGVTDDEAERERLYGFWASSDEPVTQPSDDESFEAKIARFVSVEARPDQAAFRRRVFYAYQGKCAITGCSVDSALDAAHKLGRDWRQGHNAAKDGLLLRKDLHGMYDRGQLVIDEAGVVTLTPSAFEDYGELHTRQLRSPVDVPRFIRPRVTKADC